MLCQFSFQNFKSYKAETTFDFQATAIPEFFQTLLGDEKSGKILPVGVFMDPMEEERVIFYKHYHV